MAQKARFRTCEKRHRELTVDLRSNRSITPQHEEETG
jgi:hypothetical protein